MTPVSISLTILGLITFFWPLVTVLFKRNVLNAQWLMMLAISLMAFTFVLLGSMFNKFLMGEYIIFILFLVTIIITPPIVHAALAVLTQPNPSYRPIRMLFLPSIFCIAIIILSAIVAGPDAFRLWTLRGAQGLSWQFMPGSWRYNLIVFINSYVFWAVFAFEIIIIFTSGIRKLVQFKRMNSEYYTSDRYYNVNLRGLYISANIGLLLMVLSQFTNPFADNHRFLLYFTYCAPLAVIFFYIGHSVYMINTGAEQLPPFERSLHRHKDMDAIARLLEKYVERERAFLDPNISVFLLAERFHTSEDMVIELIHSRMGVSFGEYIDSLRIEYATTQLLEGRTLDIDDTDVLSRFAHNCGYLNAADFQHAFYSVMHTSLASWIGRVENNN